MAVQCPIEMRPADLKFRLDIGQHETGVLEVEQRLTKDNPVAAKGNGFVKCLLCARHRRNRDGKAFLRQFAHQIDEALALFAQAIGHGDADIFEEQFRCVGFVHADFVKVATAFETFTLGFDKDNRHALIGGLNFGVGFDADQNQVRILAIGDIGFAAVDDVMVAILLGSGLHSLKIATSAGLSHRDGRDDLA